MLKSHFLPPNPAALGKVFVRTLAHSEARKVQLASYFISGNVRFIRAVSRIHPPPQSRARVCSPPPPIFIQGKKERSETQIAALRLAIHGAGDPHREGRLEYEPEKELIFNDRGFKTNKLLLLFAGLLFEVREAENG